MASYFVIGADGKEYGPVSAEELRRWIGEGRADEQTQLRAESATEWLPLSTVPEFAAALKKTATPPASTPPPIRAIPAGAVTATGKTSALAVASLVLGILGVCTCGTTAVFGLILGIVAMFKVSTSQGALRGRSLALTGVIVSGFFLLLMPVLAVLLLPALKGAHDRARQINCSNNEKQLALAVKIYSGDHANLLPPAATWCDAIKTSVGSDYVFKCPAANGASRCDYAFNARLDGVDANQVNPKTVMIFEADGGWNAHGGPELAATHRHRGDKLVVAFADGSVEDGVSEAQLNTLRWDP